MTVSSDVPNLVELLGPREVVGHVVAVLMAGSGLSRDAAFQSMVCDSVPSRRSVRETAAPIVARSD